MPIETSALTFEQIEEQLTAEYNVKMQKIQAAKAKRDADAQAAADLLESTQNAKATAAEKEQASQRFNAGLVDLRADVALISQEIENRQRDTIASVNFLAETPAWMRGQEARAKTIAVRLGELAQKNADAFDSPAEMATGLRSKMMELIQGINLNLSMPPSVNSSQVLLAFRIQTIHLGGFDAEIEQGYKKIQQA